MKAFPLALLEVGIGMNDDRHARKFPGQSLGETCFQKCQVSGVAIGELFHRCGIISSAIVSATAYVNDDKQDASFGEPVVLDVARELFITALLHDIQLCEPEHGLILEEKLS